MYERPRIKPIYDKLTILKSPGENVCGNYCSKSALFVMSLEFRLKLPKLKKKYITSSVLETPIKDVLDVDIGERGTEKKCL
jgi:hypothetical protein